MADLERTIKRFELFADEAKHRGIVEVPDDLILDALELLKSQQAEIERLKAEKKSDGFIERCDSRTAQMFSH